MIYLHIRVYVWMTHTQMTMIQENACSFYMLDRNQLSLIMLSTQNFFHKQAPS